MKTPIQQRRSNRVTRRVSLRANGGKLSAPRPDLDPLPLLDVLPILIWRSGRDTRCDYFNQAWLEFTGRSLEQELGNGWAEGVHPGDRERCVKHYLDAFKARRPFVLEYRLRHHDGEYRWIRDLGQPFRDGSGEFAGYIGGCFDLSERKRDEDVLKLQYAAAIAISGAPDFRTALESIVQLTCKLTGWAIGEAWLPSADGSHLEWSTAFYSSIAGIEAFVAASRKTTVAPGQYFVGKVWMSGQPSWRGEHLATSERARTIPDPPRAQCVIPVFADGNIVAILSFFSQSQRPHDQRLLDAITGIAAQLGMLLKRKQVEEALRISEQQLRRALDEREHLSRDLHDGITQEIYAIGMGLEEAQRSANTNPDAASERIAAAIASLNKVIRDVRGHIAGAAQSSTRKPRLDSQLETLIRTLDGTHQLRFRVKVDRKAASRLSSSASDQVLNIVREAMSNSLRHSACHSGLVSLQPTRAGVRVLVEDDGKGFNPRRTRSGGQGLRNIAARARDLSARLEVRSKPGNGTRIVLDIPAEALRAVA